MYKKLLVTILFIFLLAFSVNALKNVGESCLNNDECNSNICEGSLCQSASILGLLEPPECTTDANCTNEFCDTATGTCVECLDNDDCEDIDDDYPYCNATKECVGCLEDSDCGSGYDCKNGACEAIVECETDDDCEADETCEDDICEKAFCIESWQCLGWSSCYQGKQTRTCTDLNDCQNEFPYIDKPDEEQDCTPVSTASCVDGILNQGETGIDCGGPCPKCKTCNDNEQNCHDGLCEEGVDCGGSCMPCVLEEASHKVSFWIIFITGLIVLLLLVLGLWYFKLRKGAEEVGKQVDKFKPPTQPSSMLRI